MAVATIPLLLAAATPQAFDGIPHLRFVHRPIAGATIAEIHAALEASADHPPGGGSSYAHTETHIDWHWRGEGRGQQHAGRCRVTRAEVTFAAIVTLPRLADADALDDAARARWTRFDAAIQTHEAGHVRLAWARVPRVRAALLAAPCDRADVAARAIVAALARDQATYDRTTRHGATQGAHFP